MAVGWGRSTWGSGVWGEPFTEPSTGGTASRGGGARRRRPGEKVIWYDDWVRSQQEDDKEVEPSEEQIEAVEEAIETVSLYKEKTTSVVDAKAAILKSKNARDMLYRLKGLEDLMKAYFAIKAERERRNRDDDCMALFMLGVL